jgi:TfoX/Sxy family transcriptional regulator of competence genes
MAYDQELDSRIRAIVDQWPGTKAKKMFGGVCYLLNGNMVCGVHKDALFLRLGAEGADIALRQAHVSPFDITGRAMKGWVMVSMKGFQKQGELDRWLARARAFVETLPAKA